MLINLNHYRRAFSRAFQLLTLFAFAGSLYGKGSEEFLRTPFPNAYLVASLRQGLFSLELERLYWGIDADLYKSALTLVLPFNSYGVGFKFEFENLDLLRYEKAKIMFGSRLFGAKSIVEEENGEGYFLGFEANLSRLEYNTSKFHLGETDPLFEKYGKSKNSFGFGLGFSRRSRRERVGISINEIMLGNPNLEPGTKQVLLPQISLESEYQILPGVFLNGIISYQEELNLTLQGESWMASKGVGVFGGANRYGVDFGAGFRPGTKRGLEIRYRFDYPFQVGKTTSHYFTIVYKPEPLKPLFPDIVPDGLKLALPPVATLPNTLEIQIKNNGQRASSSFWVIVFENGAPISENECASIGPQGEKIIRIPYKPVTSGNSNFRVIVDSKNDVLELDETNNTFEKVVEIYPYPRIALESIGDTLILVQKTEIYQNEPIVPIVFFAPKSARVDSIYRGMINEISRRLERNPDVFLELRGFVDTDSDSIGGGADGFRLAVERAESVEAVFKKMSPAISQRIVVVRDGYDHFRKRARKQDFEGTRRGARLVSEENRRVELGVSLRDGFAPVILEDNNLGDKLTQSLDLVEELLNNNKDIILMVSAIGGKIPASDFNPHLRSARIVADSIKKLLPAGLSSRVHFEHIPTGDPVPHIRISIFASPIIFDPIRITRTSKAYYPLPQTSVVKFVPVFDFPQRISYYQLRIETGDGELFKFFGGDELPDTIVWDWLNPRGEYPSLWGNYSARIYIRDEFGDSAVSPPIPLTLMLQNLENLRESLILTEFVFGELESELQHQNARLEYIARQILRRIEHSEKGMRIELGGHTDNVGVKEGNMRLSISRAKTKLDQLRMYLFELLNLQNPGELDSFLIRKGITLSYRGYGDTQPCRVVRLEDDTPVEHLLGDNRHPLGRIINRRVEITFK